MDLDPEVDYDKDLYAHICALKKDKKKNLCKSIKIGEMLGQGVAGKVFTASVDKFATPVVVKQQIDKHAVNEFEALMYLRDQMLAGVLPGYYPFLYGSYTHDKKKHLILEKAEQNIDDFLIENRISTSIFLEIFWHIANAVSHLEKHQFNHGDLWSENVMIIFSKDTDELMIKIIDYDCAFKPGTRINHPSQGGADYKRPLHFILGYDLNRFFEALIFTYEDFLEKKLTSKKERIAEMEKLRKKGEKVTVPQLNVPDNIDLEYDEENISYPVEIVNFLYRLGVTDPNDFEDHPELSGESVKKMIEDYAKEIGVKIFADD